MDFDCEFDPQRQLIIAATTGQGSVEEFVRFKETVGELCARHPGAPVLADHSRLKADNLSMEEVRRVVDVTSSMKAALDERRYAVVVSGDLEYGLVRVWEARSDTNLSIRIFRDRQEALDWLSEDDGHAAAAP